jgi:hypothetical protein
VSMIGNRGHLRAMRLLPFAAARAGTCLTFKCSNRTDLG